MIINDESPQYLAIKQDPVKADAFPHRSCREWFSHEFYERLFDVHPYARPMFNDPKSQGNFLVALFSFIFTAFDAAPVVSSCEKHPSTSFHHRHFISSPHLLFSTHAHTSSQLHPTPLPRHPSSSSSTTQSSNISARSTLYEESKPPSTGSSGR